VHVELREKGLRVKNSRRKITNVGVDNNNTAVSIQVFIYIHSAAVYRTKRGRHS